MPRSRWSTQKELQGVLEDLVSCFFRIFFTLLIFCLFIVVSDFVLLWFESVCFFSFCFASAFCFYVAFLFFSYFLICFLEKERKIAWSWVGRQLRRI